MKKIIPISKYFNFYSAKEDKMCRKFLNNIRKEPKGLTDMPSRAKDVLSYFGLDTLDGSVPIVEILTKIGFKIYQSSLEPNGLSAYIAVDPNFVDVFCANKITCVDVRDNIGHKRFALAHELAHYIFDFDDSKDLYYYNTYFPRKEVDELEEIRANMFAFNLLMSKDEFLKKFEDCKKLQSKADTVNELAQYFLVSPKAVLERFEQLGIDEYGSLEIKD